jgi:hypothetical protein
MDSRFRGKSLRPMEAMTFLGWHLMEATARRDVLAGSSEAVLKLSITEFRWRLKKLYRFVCRGNHALAEPRRKRCPAL